MGTHFAAATEDSVIVAEELKRRWGLPKWRFTNSGSESTMDAIRLARAHTGRELVIKMEGSYHGHHDTVMVSIGIDIDEERVGPAEPAEQRLLRRRHPGLHGRADDSRAVQRRRRARRAPGRAPGPGRLRDHGARHDEHRRRPAAGRLPRRRARDHAEAQRPADLRRGQDRHHDRRRRRGRALGRRPRRRHAREGARRRPADRRDRRQRGGHGLDRERPRLPGGHVQRQPAEHGRRAREPARGHDARGLRPPRAPQQPPARRTRRDHRASTASRPT